MKIKSRTEYSILNIATGIGGYFVNTILGFICRIFFVRCLSQEYLGINGLFSNILSILSLAELGIGNAIVYALYKPLAENDERKVALLMQFYKKAYRVIGCIVAVVGVAILPFLDLIIREQPNIKENLNIIYLVFLFNTCLTYFLSYRGALLLAAQRNYIQSGLSYLISIVQSIFQIILLLYTREYYWYLGIQTIGILLYNIVIWCWVKYDYSYIVSKFKDVLSREERKDLTKNIKALTINKFTDLFVNSTDNIIITYFNGLVAVGNASNYTLLSGTVATITNTLFGNMTASVGNFNAIESEENKYDFFKVLQMATFWIFGWATMGIVFVSTDLVGFLFGTKYILADNIPFVLGLNFFLVTMQTSVSMYRSTLGLFQYGQYVLIFTAIINLVLSIWLGNIWGIFGIYIATSFARILTNNWYIPYAVFKYGLKRKPRDYFKRYISYVLVICADGLICFLICSKLHFSYLSNTILKALICSIVPNAMFCIVYHKTEEYSALKAKVQTLVMKMIPYKFVIKR